MSIAEDLRVAAPARPRRITGEPGLPATARRRQRASGSPIPVWEDVRRIPGLPESSAYTGLSSRDAVFRRGLGLADVVSAYVALLLALSVIGRHSFVLRPAAVLLAPFVVLVSKAIGLYDRDQHAVRKTTVDEVPAIVHLSVAYALAVWLGERLLFPNWLGRPEVFGLALAFFGLAILGRTIARRTALALTAPERCVVVGSLADARRTAGKLASCPGVKAIVIGRIALRPGDQAGARDLPTLGDIDGLGGLTEQHRIDRAIIAPDSHDQEDTLHVIRLLKALSVKVSVLPRLLEAVGSSSTFDEVDGMTLLGVRPYGLSKSSAFLKRAMDIAGASLGLVVLTPALILLVVAIKLDSPGLVFFRQQRIGKGGRRFEMFKFRSMVSDAEGIKPLLGDRNEAVGGLFKIRDDPRITRVGGLLRRMSIDELPQLINVLAGHMSLVGPRPLVPSEDALIEGWQRRRLVVKPGMTGLWQIFGSARIPMHEMVKIDYLYGANWSVWLDVKILLRTVPYVLSRRGQ